MYKEKITRKQEEEIDNMLGPNDVDGYEKEGRVEKFISED